MKCCSHCRQAKPVAMFYKDRSSIDGLQHRCRGCSSRANAKSRVQATPEQRATELERLREYGARHRAANPARERERGRAYYEVNRTKVLERQRLLRRTRPRVRPAIEPSGPCFLYRLFSETGGLLYVGITKDFRRRLAEHGREPKPFDWFAGVNHWSVVEYRNRDTATRMEAMAIDIEQPVYNVKGNADWLETRALMIALRSEGHDRD